MPTMLIEFSLVRVRLHTEKRPMMDYILATPDPAEWHAQNIDVNRHHYSSLAALGGRAVSYVADNVGVGVHFNTLVPWRDQQLIKYGVVSTEKLLGDLHHWESLYISGRLHKPVMLLTVPADDGPGTLRHGLAANLQSALTTALLLLPEKFTEEELFASISSLSYMGDVRMAIAEDRHKVRRIVHNNLPRFQHTYQAPIDIAATRQWVQRLAPSGQGGSLAQDVSPAAREQQLMALPSSLQRAIMGAMQSHLPGHLSGGKAGTGTDAAMAALAGVSDRESLVKEGLAALVRASSRRQAVAGLFSAGLRKSIMYAGRKMMKAFMSRLH
eukprot:jgi/Mesvir1/15393/Mv06580-RA.1